MNTPTGAFTRTNGFGADARKAYPRFYIASIQDELASQRAGRPIFKQVERVDLILPGNPHTRPTMEVTEEVKAEYAEAYKMFKSGQERPVEGTPLDEWPFLNAGMVAELKHLNIHTIEQCAALDDLSIQRIGLGGRALKERAVSFMDDAERMKTEERLRAELDMRDSRISALETQLSAVQQLMQSLQSENVNLRATPNPITQVAPFLNDPMQPAPQSTSAPASSALDVLAAPKRRGRPPKNQQAA